jgi:hypothetical protein
MHQHGPSGPDGAGGRAGAAVDRWLSRPAREGAREHAGGRGETVPHRDRSGPRRRSFLLAAGAFLSLAGFSAAPVRAGVSEISNSATGPNSGPHTNNNGLAAWNGTSNSQPAVYLWNNGSTQQLGNTTLFDSQPNFSLSNSGQVVWQYQTNPPVGQDFVAGSEIFLWNGTGASPLSPHTNGEGHIYPVINSSNEVAWVHVYYPVANQNRLSFDIQLWNGSANQITTTYVPKTNLHINDSGLVVWQQADAFNQIYLWNGMAVQRLSDGSADSVHPQINNNGQVVWQQYDNVPNQVGTNHYQIYLWNGTQRQQLTNDSADDTDPQLNNRNQVVWVQHGDPTIGTPSNVYEWNGSTFGISQNTTYNGDISVPWTSDAGFVGWTQAPPPLTPGLSTVYVWNGGTEIQTIATNAMFGQPSLDGLPRVVWMGQDTTALTCEVNFYQPVLPAVPSNLTATAVSSSQINLTWVDNSTNATAIAVWRSTNGPGGPFSRIAVLVPSAASYSDTGLTANTAYTYEVRATNNVGASWWSNVVTATTPAH